jgi:hypothetical protein
MMKPKSKSPKAAVAPKGRKSSAQGNALGRRFATMMVALKGRDLPYNTDWSHPVGVPEYDGDANPGRCPGLTVNPSGSFVPVRRANKERADG